MDETQTTTESRRFGVTNVSLERVGAKQVTVEAEGQHGDQLTYEREFNVPTTMLELV